MSERRYKNPQVNLRLPEELKEKIAAMAERNKRSANAEMVAAIEEWVRRDEVYNYRSETSLIIPISEADLDDNELLTMPKANMSELINKAAEEAAHAALNILLDRYDLTPKSNDKKPT